MAKTNTLLVISVHSFSLFKITSFLYLHFHSGMIQPKTIDLPVDSQDFGRHRSGKDQHFKKKNFIYIPIVPQLEAYLNFEDVFLAVHKPKEKKNGHLFHFEDGEAFKINPFFQDFNEALQIHVYIDEVGMTSDRGNRSKKNKLVYVYGALGNLEPKHRSTFKSMFLLSIFHNTLMARFGLNVLLRPLVTDLKDLENGVSMKIGMNSQIVRGTLVAIIADNLASHQIGGFKIGFSKGFRKCRFCLGTDDDIQNGFFDSDFVPRTKDQHDRHCASLNTPELREHFQRLYGIVSDSILNELLYFHVIGGLAPDVMHDILEGILPLVLGKLILHCLKEKYFNLAKLNDIIDKFKYGHREIVSKPSAIAKASLHSGDINQSASQLWLLAINFPLMVGHFVNTSDDAWHCFTVLLQICRIVFLDSISFFQIDQLEQLIEEFLIGYKNSFHQSYKKDNKNYGKKCRIIPKMHHLVHYPRYIRLLGPLKSFWCMRFEAKHSYFKTLQRRIRNYINPPKTLSTRHQQWQCNQFRSAGKTFLKFPISKSRSTTRLLSNHACAGQLASLLNIDAISEDDIVHELNWVDIGANKFKKNESLILCSLNGGTRCAFGMISSIISLDEKLFFCCKMYRTLGFNNHYQAFRLIKREDNFQLVVSPFDLHDLNVYQLHSPSFRSTDLYVTTRTDIHLDVL